MPSIYTPLRYPGGKSKLSSFLAELFRRNRLIDGAYAEPYAGGAGAALFLLFRGYASRIHLNDIDVGVVAFWRAVLRHTEQFARRIETIPLTVHEWDQQKEIYRTATSGFALGFAFFYLNRTNRSGILNGGIIGGRSQCGEWRMDARFNRPDLAERVRAIGRMRKFISIGGDDAINFVEALSSRGMVRSLICCDPPYFKKGRELYKSCYRPEDHARIAECLQRVATPWLVTYDDRSEIRRLYRGYRILETELSYSAREARRGREIVILSRGLKPPLTKFQRGRGNPGFKVLIQGQPSGGAAPTLVGLR